MNLEILIYNAEIISFDQTDSQPPALCVVIYTCLTRVKKL